MKRFRFSISFLLIAVAVVAVSLVLLDEIRFKNRWAETREKLSTWETLPRGYYSDHTNSFDIVARDGNPVNVTISTTSFEAKENGIALTYDEKDRKTYFIYPPGKWVEDLDEVFRIWDKL